MKMKSTNILNLYQYNKINKFSFIIGMCVFFSCSNLNNISKDAINNKNDIVEIIENEISHTSRSNVEIIEFLKKKNVIQRLDASTLKEFLYKIAQKEDDSRFVYYFLITTFSMSNWDLQTTKLLYELYYSGDEKGNKIEFIYFRKLLTFTPQNALVTPSDNCLIRITEDYLKYKELSLAPFSGTKTFYIDFIGYLLKNYPSTRKRLLEFENQLLKDKTTSHECKKIISKHLKGEF